MNDTNRPQLGATLRELRKQRGWTLATMSKKTGFSISTLSKVERDLVSLTYDKLLQLSEKTGVEISDLFSAPNAVSVGSGGRRSINLRGKGEPYATKNYVDWFLHTDVLHKKFFPSIIEPRARSIEEFGPLISHSGEEFVFVLEGEVEVHTDRYAPFLLRQGDSAYLDSKMGHAYICKSNGPCRVLGISSATEINVEELRGPPRRPAKSASVASRKKSTRR